MDTYKLPINANEKEKQSGTIRQVLNMPIILGQPVFASPVTQTTIGGNGSASALTANPVGYIQVMIGVTQYIIPFYNVA